MNIDRVACPWLIKKLVDPHVEFIFVAATEVAAKAQELCVTPSDIEGWELGHRGGFCRVNPEHTEKGRVYTLSSKTGRNYPAIAENGSATAISLRPPSSAPKPCYSTFFLADSVCDCSGFIVCP